MKRLTIILLSLFGSLTLLAQERSHDIESVDVFGTQSLKDIGVHRSVIDTATLHQSISHSMSDILTFNSSIFVKSYGRATLSTVSFRGTSASHTQVTWNHMRINSPMLGMTDFSMIPSLFIDSANILHGTSSVSQSGGGLGGLIELSSLPSMRQGFDMEYVQGVGSFSSFDEYARLSYGNDRLKLSTRFLYQSSPNDYEYINRDKKENIYDEDYNIIDQYYPSEVNKSGAYRDLHLLQELYYTSRMGDIFSLKGWWLKSYRELPLLTTDYSDENDFENTQRENTLRAVASWDRYGDENWRIGASSGYIRTDMRYDYKVDIGNSVMASMVESSSLVNTLYGKIDVDYSLGERWLLAANINLHQHFVESGDKSIILTSGEDDVVGYVTSRAEISCSATISWHATDRLGLSSTLRYELYGAESAPIIPAFFADYLISRRSELRAKASASRNYRHPSLNDLYFLPGGNPDLEPESGFSYDVGVSFSLATASKKLSLDGSLSYFDSYIDNWIIWLPTTKGYFSPSNIKSVHAYGVECDLRGRAQLSPKWHLTLGGAASYTPSINEGEPLSAGDQSIGKQLPYVPLFSASVNGSLSYDKWSLGYDWCHYSQRYTMSSNDTTITGYLPPYYMSNISLSRAIDTPWCNFNIRLAVNNLFNEEYISQLSHPMPGINYQLYLGLRPKW